MIANATLIQAIVPEKSVYFSFNGVSWYLSLTLFFALLTPVAIKIWKHLTIKLSVVLALMLFVIELLLVCFFGHLNFGHWVMYIFPLTRFFDFLIGGDISSCSIYKRKSIVQI